MLLAINFFNYLDRSVLAAVEPSIRDALLKDQPESEAMAKTGLLSTAFLFAYMFGAPLFGWLADRMSRWWLIGFGVIVWSLASGASGWEWPVASLAMAYWILLITRCFVGIGEAAYGPAAPTIISDLFPIQNRGRMLSWFYLAIPVGNAAGYALGGFMVSFNAEVGWRWAFFSVVPLGVLLGVVCFFLPEPRRGAAESPQDSTVLEPKPSRFRNYAAIFRTPSYVIDTVGMTAMTFSLGAIAYWMPAYFKTYDVSPVRDIPPTAFFGIVVASGGFLGTLTGGMLADALRPILRGSYFVVSGVGMIFGFFMVLLVLWIPFPTAWIFMFGAVFFLFLNTGPTNTVLANVTHPSVRASAFALNIFIIHILGDAISPPLIGAIAGRWSLRVGLYVVSAAILLAGIVWLYGARHLEADTEKVAAAT